MAFDRLQPYNDLPLLPPQAELETKAVLKQAIAANRVLANLRGLAAQIPNQGMLINSIALQEARLSSEIENIVTTNDELYRADADPEGRTRILSIPSHHRIMWRERSGKVMPIRIWAIEPVGQIGAPACFIL